MEDQIIEDLTLLLLYLTSWEEPVYGDDRPADLERLQL